MVIREMSKEQCVRVLARTRLVRLACTYENQPYVIPVYLVYHELPGGEACFYGFATPGQKVEWMRANPLVCVEVDEVTAHDRWVSVIAFGRYGELPEVPGRDDERLRAQQRPRRVREAPRMGEARPETPESDDERFRAWQLLKTHPTWGEPGFSTWAARARRGSAEPFIPVYYRIQIDRVTGHEATPDTREAISSVVPAPPAGRRGWLRKTLTRVFGRRSKEAGSFV